MGWFDYGPDYLLPGLAVGLGVSAVIAYGSVTGSLSPIASRPAWTGSSSAPFMSTIVDATGIVICFGIADLVLRGQYSDPQARERRRKFTLRSACELLIQRISSAAHVGGLQRGIRTRLPRSTADPPTHIIEDLHATP
jgi:hypothetical protein